VAPLVLRLLSALPLLAWAASSAAQTPDELPPPQSQGVKFAEPLRITPEKPACFLAGRFPVVRATIDPWATVESARVHFRPEGYRLWYSVPMHRTSEGFLARLPKPRPSAQRVRYFVEATATAYRLRTRSLEHTVAVVEQDGQCAGAVAAAVESAAIPVQVPKGAPRVPPVPPGFVPAGTVPDEGPGNGTRDALVAAGAGAAALGAVFVVRPQLPDPVDRGPNIAPELTVLASTPPPGSTLSIGEGAPLSLRVRVRLHQAVHPGQVTVTLYRLAEGFLRPCGILAAAHDGFLQGAVNDIEVAGALQQARPCDPSDRVRIVLTQLGSAFLTTGTPGLPDGDLRYFVVP
jgi:hypothetical protein